MKYTSLLAVAVLSSLIPAAFAQGESGDPGNNGRGPGLNGPPDNIEAHPPLHFRPDVSASPSGLTPTQVKHAYGFDKINGDGTGQTIAIIDAYGSPTLQSDLNTFCATYGLPMTTLNIAYPQGKTAPDSGWALETSLDVEWAHAIAPGAKILVVVAKSASLSNLLDAVDYAVKQGAKQVSMSWGGSEFSGESNSDYHFNKPGISFVASSGDNGAGVSWPASSPYILSVGGTTLKVDANGNVISETSWSGSGGGVSAYEVRPAYQNGWQPASGRAIPDVSYNADPNTGVPVYISKYKNTNGWVTVGGTSAGAPQWAALLALVNAARASSLNAVNIPVYSLASTAYATDYRDITVGTNGGYAASLNYDYVTGLGSPLAASLVPALTGF